MERDVEDGDVRDVWQRPARALDCGQRELVVQRDEVGERRELVIDHDRLPEPLAAVDDAVHDRLDIAQRGRHRRHRLGRTLRAGEATASGPSSRRDD